jgi:protein SERAC1
MIFLGTPFYGSKIAGWGEVVRRIYSLVQKTDQNTLKNLKLDSEELRDLRLGFPDVIRKRNENSVKIAAVFFFEKKMTYKVVSVESQTRTNLGH